MNHSPEIECAICGKPVDRIVSTHDQIKDVIRLKVWCHGDTDEMFFGMSDIAKLGARGFETMLSRGCVAFTRQKAAQLEAQP